MGEGIHSWHILGTYFKALCDGGFIWLSPLHLPQPESCCLAPGKPTPGSQRWGLHTTFFLGVATSCGLKICSVTGLVLCTLPWQPLDLVLLVSSLEHFCFCHPSRQWTWQLLGRVGTLHVLQLSVRSPNSHVPLGGHGDKKPSAFIQAQTLTFTKNHSEFLHQNFQGSIYA